MATQLATLFLRRLEVPIVLTDVDAERATQAVESIRGELAGLVAKGRLSEGKARFLGSIVTTGGRAPRRTRDATSSSRRCSRSSAVKREVFGALEEVVSPECLLVTNTSALSVAAMGEGLAHPERVVGLHFFNPVAVLPLVEVVRTPATDDATLATAWDVTKKLGKRGVLVKDAPAFVVNRMLTRQSTVLMQALENGNTIEETDEAALRLGLPMPPFGAARDGRPARREPRPADAERGVPGALPALPDAARRWRTASFLRSRRRTVARPSRRSTSGSSRRSPTRRGTSSTTESSRPRRRSTPA